jgi:hypothetical protein
MENALTFGRGKIELARIHPKVDIKTTGYWRIRSTENGSVENVPKLLGIATLPMATILFGKTTT